MQVKTITYTEGFGSYVCQFRNMEALVVGGIDRDALDGSTRNRLPNPQWEVNGLSY